jgi:hypothetical protein
MAANTSIKSFGTHPADASAQRREAQVIEQRRSIEQQRLNRLLDPKLRTIGVDKHTLDEQVADRARQQEIEKIREASFAQSAIAVDHQLQLIDRETARQRKQISVEESQYRHDFQQKHQRKEWDLSNPSALKSEGPARQSDSDPALHVSGLQKLQGEDLSNPVRFKKQQQQMRDWIKVQLEEKQRRIEAERAIDQHFSAYGSEISGISGDIEAENIRARKEHNLSVKEFNIAMAEERRRREQAQREQDTTDAFEEINNNLTSQFLSEDPATTISHMNPNRNIKYHFKGISPEQHAAIMAERALQLRDKEEHKLREKEQDAQWAALQSSVVRTLEEQEQAVSRMRKEHNQSVARELGRQVVVHSEKEHFVNKVLHSNSVGQDFYKHFGASCR